jgi:hypothetical protein
MRPVDRVSAVIERDRNCAFPQVRDARWFDAVRY